MKEMILIADSGSTKTDWCLVSQGRKKKWQTEGIHPLLMSEVEILQILRKSAAQIPHKQPQQIHFYGAGIPRHDSKSIITRTLKTVWDSARVQTYSDMLGAARALCQHEKGIVCILGTGSNSASYNGKKITFKIPALGYLLGDEGGGSTLGKKVLQYHLHRIFEPDLEAEFQKKYPLTDQEILTSVYQKSMPNRYLAQFASFIFDHRGHYMIENILEDGINDFFLHHVIRYPGLKQMPVHFCGSVAILAKDIIRSLCDQYEIKCGRFLKQPIDGLVRYHPL